MLPASHPILRSSQATFLLSCRVSPFLELECELPLLPHWPGSSAWSHKQRRDATPSHRFGVCLPLCPRDCHFLSTPVLCSSFSRSAALSPVGMGQHLIGSPVGPPGFWCAALLPFLRLSLDHSGACDKRVLDALQVVGTPPLLVLARFATCQQGPVLLARFLNRFVPDTLTERGKSTPRALCSAQLRHNTLAYGLARSWVGRRYFIPVGLSFYFYSSSRNLCCSTQTGFLPGPTEKIKSLCLPWEYRLALAKKESRSTGRFLAAPPPRHANRQPPLPPLGSPLLPICSPSLGSHSWRRVLFIPISSCSFLSPTYPFPSTQPHISSHPCVPLLFAVLPVSRLVRATQ